MIGPRMKQAVFPLLGAHEQSDELCSDWLVYSEALLSAHTEATRQNRGRQENKVNLCVNNLELASR